MLSAKFIRRNIPANSPRRGIRVFAYLKEHFITSSFGEAICHEHPTRGIGVFAYIVPYKFFPEKQVSVDYGGIICKALMRQQRAPYLLIAIRLRFKPNSCIMRKYAILPSGVVYSDRTKPLSSKSDATVKRCAVFYFSLY